MKSGDAAIRTINGAPVLHFGVAEDQGKREYMEDRSCIINDFRPLGTADHPDNATTTLSGVFDGHLSAKAAEMAANNLHEHLAKEDGYLKAIKRGGEINQEAISLALRRAFQLCDDEIVEMSKAEDNWKGGSTACIALTIDRDLFVAHVGDSGAFCIRDGAARRLTIDHKPTNPAEQKRIANAGGKINQTLDRVYSAEAGTMLAMSRALGDANFKEGEGSAFVSNRPDVRHLLLTEADTAVVIASDGLTDVMSDQDAAEIILEFTQEKGSIDGAAQRAADALVKSALERGTSDNVTALVIVLDWESATHS